MNWRINYKVSDELAAVVAVSSVELFEMLHQMRQEQQTWQLVSTLYRDRLDSAAHGDVNDVVMDDTSVGLFHMLCCRLPVGLVLHAFFS